MGAVLAPVAAGFSIVSGLTTAIGGIVNARAQARSAQQAVMLQHEQAEADALAARQDAADEEGQRRRDLTRILASQRAILAGSGADLDSPTNQAIAADSVEQAEMDLLRIQANVGRVITTGQRQTRSAAIAGRDVARRAHTGAIIGIGQGIGSIIGGAQRYVDHRASQAAAAEARVAQERARP
jgi:hypothetical protein